VELIARATPGGALDRVAEVVVDAGSVAVVGAASVDGTVVVALVLHPSCATETLTTGNRGGTTPGPL
jgi:hypothetical protein